MGWRLWRIDVTPEELLRDDCTCVDNCKEFARRLRKEKDKKTWHFKIADPVGNDWQYMISDEKRMSWGWFTHR